MSAKKKPNTGNCNQIALPPWLCQPYAVDLHQVFRFMITYHCSTIILCAIIFINQMKAEHRTPSQPAMSAMQGLFRICRIANLAALQDQLKRGADPLQTVLDIRPTPNPPPTQPHWARLRRMTKAEHCCMLLH